MLDIPWAEKYRPKTLDMVIGQKPIVKRLKDFVKTRSFPSMIFAGPAGIGKTSSAIAFATELYGDEINQAFLELNASDARGIDVIRGKVKEFARTMPLSSGIVKIIFLDEADALTPEAQHALRRTMEKYANATRFILSVNYASKIIEPIQSRCIVFRFKPLKEDEMRTYINRIVEGENLKIDENAIKALIYVSDGDLRKLTNLLQGVAIAKKEIKEEDIYEIAAMARPKEINNMIRYALNGDFYKAREELDKLMLDYGMSGDDIVTQVYREIISMNGISDYQKLNIVKELGETNFRITEGANERIQLEAFIAKLALLPKQ